MNLGHKELNLMFHVGVIQLNSSPNNSNWFDGYQFIVFNEKFNWEADIFGSFELEFELICLKSLNFKFRAL